MAKKRLDVLMVEKGLVESRQKAQAIIMAVSATHASVLWRPISVERMVL